LTRSRARATARAVARARANARSTVGGGDRRRRPQDERRRGGRAAALVGEIFVEAVAAEQRAFGGDLARARVRPPTADDQANAVRAAPTLAATRAAQPAATRSAWPDGSGRRAETDERDPLRAHVAHVHDQRLPELGAKPLLADGASQDAAAARVRALEQAIAGELCLSKREHEQVGFEVGGLVGRDDEVGHGGCARVRRACVRVESGARHFKARQRG
jgi:hypothetical protein